MLSEKVLFAINDTDDGTLEAVSRRLGYQYEKSPARIGRLSRRAVLLAAVIAAFLALSATAYAANLWGIREMFTTPNRELSEAAAELITSQSESAQGEGFRCQVTESLCDATQILMTVTVTGGEEYILAPTDAMPEDPLGVIGRDGEGTLADYAAAQGKKLLYVSAGLTLQTPNGPEILSGGLTFKNISDSEMAILIQANRPSGTSLTGAVCIVTAVAEESTEPQRVELPVELADTAEESVEIFAPVDPDAIPGVHIGEATVIKTPLGISIEFAEFPSDPDNMELLHNMVKFEFDEITYYHSSVGLNDDGVWTSRVTGGRGILTDTLTIHFYDWDRQPVGDIVFKKK